MPLFDHLGELRMRLVRIVACLFIAVCVFYWAAPTLITFLLQPIADLMPHDVTGEAMLISLDPFETFATNFKVALWASVVTCSPIILWQILAFFLPVLRPKERKWFLPAFAVGVALFIAGTVFCYCIILHPAFEFLTTQGEGYATLAARASSFTDTIIKFELGFGFAFELPLVVFFLVVGNIVPYKKLRGAWRTVYVVLMVLSAMITPDASPVTMMLLFAAMIAMYEVSLLVSRVILAKRIKKQNEEMAAEEAEEA